MKILKDFWYWLVMSSANPQKIALTVRAGVPLLVLLGVGTQVELDLFADNIINLILAWGAVVATIGTAYGASRKVAKTVYKLVK
jgi:hypothetical protein